MSERLAVNFPRSPRLALIYTKTKPMRLRVYEGRRTVAEFKSDEPLSPADVEFARLYDPKNPPEAA